MACTVTSFLVAAACVLVSAPARGQVQQSWVAKYVDPTTDSDRGNDVLVLPDDDVVVVGSCTAAGGAGGRDFLTVRYDAQGTQKWARRYDGPQQDDDEALEVARDEAGDLIVVGLSRGTATSATDYGLAVCKYGPDGTLKWVRRYEQLGPNWSSWGQWGGLGLDASSNVYVTVNIHTNAPGAITDIATLSYDTSGNLRWVAIFDGPVAGLDVGLDLAVAPGGDVLVSGISEDPSSGSCVTLSYSTIGTLLWIAREPAGAGERITVDPKGVAYVLGAESTGAPVGDDLFVLAYDGSGQRLWKSSIPGPGDNQELPVALRAGTAGDVYVTALTRPISFPYWEDIFTLRLGPGGDPLWARTFGSAGAIETSRDIDVDLAGNVYVTGESWYYDDLSSSRRFLTLKYGPAGDLLWSIGYGIDHGPGTYPNASAFALDLEGAGAWLVVSGVEWPDMTTVRYDQAPPPIVYCTSQPSSVAGCTPGLGAGSSLASVSAGTGSCDLICAPVPGGSQAGLAFYTTQGSLLPPKANAFGWMCVKPGPGLFRLPAGLSTGTPGQCDGLYDFDLGGWLVAQTIDPTLVPGASMDLQVWYRDPGATSGANLSNALTLHLIP